MVKETNIYEIAQKAGVSPSTVSKVINNYSEIGSETREKVMKIMNELNYVPNVNARSLASSRKGKSSKKGCISIALAEEQMNMMGLTHPLNAIIYNGMIREVNEHELDIFTDIIKSDYRETIDLPRTVRNGLVDGVIVLSSVNEKFILQLINMKIPVVLVGHAHYLKEKIDMVVGDNIGAAYSAVKHLIDMGHKKIGIVGMSIVKGESGEAHYNMTERLAGYKLALIDNGIEINEDYIELLKYPVEEISNAMDRLLKKKDIPTAVYMMFGTLTTELKNIIESNGLKIPDDISIIGDSYGDLHDITCIDLNFEEIGRSAVKRLIDIVNDENSKPSRTTVVCKLIEGKSVKRIN